MFHLEGTDLWLTPTAEVELTSLYRDETLDADTLPIKVCAWTACFRSEAGAAGKDTRGIKRQHQFQKVEMFKFTRPEQSYDELESLVRNAETMLQRLGLHYRVVQLCTGGHGLRLRENLRHRGVAAVDRRVHGDFVLLELRGVSGAPLGDSIQAQGRRKSEFVHTLNGSGLAVGRTWLAIIENYQQADGSIMIPEALVPYMGVERIGAKGEGRG